MADLASMSMPELRETLKTEGLPDYRATQIFEWLQRWGIPEWSAASNLPKALRERLQAEHPILGCKTERKQTSRDGTVKYLFQLHDGEQVESVLLKYEHGYSLCVSSQAGCARGCIFCASTIGGCRRNLSACEILGQIHAVQRDLHIRIGHTVLMGMGEPLDNLDSVLRFLALATDGNGLGLSIRNISLSTCGVVPRIHRLATHRLGLTLSVSLHAPNDELRSQLMPVNREYPLGKLIPVCRDYAIRTGRRVSFEYVMLRGVNDRPAQAKQLAALIHSFPAHVNLIPVNPASRGNFEPSTPTAAAAFRGTLEIAGITATMRRTLGQDIDAACGQLRNTVNP
ncbi:MAG: 23S rRNA (adenine(2503)-C(2))-methyltransferase RlmN [Oscillospiraceae bacterium]|jgi:23S rRNA (adenine2503-C2)-methyltransferase|nr:23S rRNA (adenine(2503)-C(2))-methyltransferase RlmN [Oscillospiraceae bacterium]